METARGRKMAAAKDLRCSDVGDPWKKEGEDVFVSPFNNNHHEEVLIFDELMADGSVEVEITPVKGIKQPESEGEPKVGLAVFRYVDPGNYYFAGIGAWGAKYCIGRMTEGRSRHLAGSGDR